jgi:hypothetical protein
MWQLHLIITGNFLALTVGGIMSAVMLSTWEWIADQADAHHAAHAPVRRTVRVVW